jgi:hypothetical protein
LESIQKLSPPPIQGGLSAVAGPLARWNTIL